MKKKMIKEFTPLLLEQLLDVYHIEKESKRIIPKLKEATSNNQVKATLEAQLVTSNFSINSINKIISEIDFEIDNTNCELVKVVVKKAESYLESDVVTDAGIISHVDRINQYKIAIYNAAVRFAKELQFFSMNKELQNLSNQTYNIIDRFGRLNNDQSDERAIHSL